MSRLTSINDDLAHVTIVIRLEFKVEIPSGQCSLVLELVDDASCPTVQVLVEAREVSGLSVKDLGGGITQLLCLQARDVSDRQLDRVRYFLEDLERDALSLACEELTISRVSCDTT